MSSTPRWMLSDELILSSGGVIYSDDAALFLESFTEGERALLADCNQMRNYGRPGYEYEWAPTEHTAAFEASMGHPSSLQLAEVSPQGAITIWTPRVELLGAVGLIGLTLALLVARRKAVNAAAQDAADFPDDYNPSDDFYQPLLE
ncbi:hypothetical protein Ae201684P_009954 [Aphanomyces euteiches]|uniref:Uncharacterized protein n=1 Tax=Aphanomyces euteiches TaxID=100861 RepID=A0A6G0XH37_9STRA|nr:hypothetical protein Ae201684_004959 [Aphanomyces euteiches]KAH9082631.1 hypothetical protein Ae201684P_009954 [Aphanomyces euteiches]KAH9155310.1 hypothetical protein AeRB84_002705 [Aphanomyces euteiches]